MREFSERERRKPGARGASSGSPTAEPWLLAEPIFRPTSAD